LRDSPQPGKSTDETEGSVAGGLSKTSIIMTQPKLPTLNKFSDEPIYNTKAAVQLSGVPAPTLRAWERRYGVLSPERAGNTYRLYSERDVVTIRWLREMIESGMTIRRAVDLLHRLNDDSNNVSLDEIGENFSRNGHTLPKEGEFSFINLQTRLLNAFLQLDEREAEAVMTEALGVYNVEDFCVLLLEPVMSEVGERWAAGTLSVTVEHFASAVVRAQLFNLFKTSPRTEKGPLVLASCAPGEYHEIGLLIVALFLRRYGLRVVYLGQSIEVSDFMASIHQWKPNLVLISVATMAGLGGLVEISRRLEELPENEQPHFSYGGRVFNIHPELVAKLPGYFLGVNAIDASRKVRELVRANFAMD
jgi:MerR family transcriptional regulator, light-induced transcriptional regulator